MTTLLLNSLYLYFILVILRTIVVLKLFWQTIVLSACLVFFFVRIQLYVLRGVLLPSLLLYINIFFYIFNQRLTES